MDSLAALVPGALPRADVARSVACADTYAAGADPATETADHTIDTTPATPAPLMARDVGPGFVLGCAWMVAAFIVGFVFVVVCFAIAVGVSHLINKIN